MAPTPRRRVTTVVPNADVPIEIDQARIVNRYAIVNGVQTRVGGSERKPVAADSSQSSTTARVDSIAAQVKAVEEYRRITGTFDIGTIES